MTPPWAAAPAAFAAPCVDVDRGRSTLADVREAFNYHARRLFEQTGVPDSANKSRVV
ncbi:hypothetical protein [Streptomyces sp. PA5.6]|uniref:hypothetical protein n=1 Tax=Streptomyces sp. PA5.6 TaxID=3035651 RepID=UPI003904AAD7